MIYFEHRFIDSDNKIAEFFAIENGENLGECTLFLAGNFAEVTKVIFADNKEFIVEGLLKAAFNFAANRNYYMGRCNVCGIEFCLDRMNFSKTENGYENDIPSILAGSCKNCCK